MKFVTVFFDVFPPDAVVIWSQTKTDYLELFSVVELEQGVEKVRQWMVCEVVGHVADSYFEEVHVFFVFTHIE